MKIATYTHGKKSKVSATAPSSVAFAWTFSALVAGTDLSGKVEIRHEGRCGRCGRPLTVPESIDCGFGPECADKLGIDWSEGEVVRFDALRFILAGKAVVTVTSVKTGARFTYRVKKAPANEGKKTPWFVSVLTGPDNTRDYTYLGTIWGADEDGAPKPTKKTEADRAWRERLEEKAEFARIEREQERRAFLSDPDFAHA